MPVDWGSYPSLSQLWADFVAAIRGRDESAAKMDFSGDTNLPVGVLRFNRATKRLEEWNGTSWVVQPVDITQVTGILPGANFNDTAHGNRSGGALHAAATGSSNGFMSSSDKSKLDGSTSAATANALMQRDASGRAKVAAPSAFDDIARKDTVDNHANATTAGVHGSTSNATANTLMHRDANGRAKVAAPSASDDIARKAEVDAIKTGDTVFSGNPNFTGTMRHLGVYGGLLPVGALVPYAGASAPSGFLLCYGQAVSRTTYANLFNVIGTTYGAGDGSTTFNLPDLRGRSPIGAGQGDTAEGGGTGTNRTLGSKVGAETHTLSTSEMPVHNHPVNDPGHSHDVTTSPVFSQTPNNYIYARDGASPPSSTGTSSNTTGITVGNAGGGGAHNNMQPSLVINFIIKY